MKTEMNIFELLHEKYTLPKTVRLFETFAGIGCQRMAFNRLGIEVDMVGISEIDKYAIKSYMAIHGETKNWGSICDVRGQDLPQIDVFTYSFPCTDLSKAGKQKGLSQTRSGLVYEVLRILHEMTDLPKVLIMENVVDLVQSKFIRQFNEIQAELESLGYTNYAETMNAKDFGVAQNRDRIFMVSVLGGKYYEFPKPFTLTKRLKDYLEANVDEKYYLSEKALNWVKTSKFECNTRVNDIDGVAACIDTMGGGNREPKIEVVEPYGVTLKNQGKEYGRDIDVAMTLMARDYKGFGNQEMNAVVEPYIEQIGRGFNDGGTHELCPPITSNAWQENNKLIEPVCLNSKVNGKQPSLQDRIYDSEAIATAVTTGFMPSVMEPIENGFYKQAIETLNENSCEYGDTINAFNRTVDKSGNSPTLTTRPEGKKTAILPVTKDLRIRKLTPLECWRLMGIADTDFAKASQVCSNSQLYKQAGNGIVVDVFAEILRTMKEIK